VTAFGAGGGHRLQSLTESAVPCSVYSVSFSSVPLAALCLELVRSALIPSGAGVLIGIRFPKVTTCLLAPLMLIGG